jgi:hypothetical protein
MTTHAQRVANSRLAGRSPFCRFAAWVNAKREARRARRLEEETIEFLRAIGPELRHDIGVDISKFGEPQMFARQNPHVLAPLAFTQPRSQPSGRRKRSRSKSS